MVEIILGNSFSQIKNLTNEQYSALRKVLSYTPNKAAAYFMGGRVFTKPLIDKKGNFPAGLLYRAISHMVDKNIHYTVRTPLKAPKGSRMHSLSLPNISPYPDQLKSIKEAVKAKRGTISMVTGYGKSVTMALLINALQVKTLVIVPNLELKRQLREVFKEAFGTLKNIVVENIDSTNLKNLTDFDCLILDEVHHGAARTYHKLNKQAWGKIYYRFGFTATPFRNQEEEQILLECIAGQVIYEVGYKKAAAQGAVVPIEAYYYNLPKVQTDAYTWREVYNELVIRNGYRNCIIADLLCRLESAEVSTLCLVKEIEHGNTLSEMSGVPFVNGEDEESKSLIADFNSGKIKALIGTVGVIGEGVDTKPCEYVIIAGLGKAKSAFMQNIGRAIRRYPGKESAKVILFRDTSHRFTLQHFKSQVKVLKEEYGVNVLELEA